MPRPQGTLVQSDFSGGQNSSFPDRRIADNEYRILRNVEMSSQPLGLRTRLGYTSLSRAGDVGTRRIHNMHLHRWDLLGTPFFQFYIWDSTSNIGTIADGGAWSSLDDGSNSRPILSREARGNIWWIDNVNRLSYFTQFVSSGATAGLLAPTTVGTLGTAAGALTGRFRYRLYYQSDSGNASLDAFTFDGTPITITSDVSPSSEISPSAQNVTFTGIPVSADGRVNVKRLYRTRDLNAFAEQYFFLAELTNATTTYTDSTADASLGAALDFASGERSRSPLSTAASSAQFIEWFANRMWVWHGNQKEGWMSASANPHYYDTTATGPNPVRITGLGNIRATAVFQERQYLFLDSQTWVLAGTDFSATGRGVVSKVLDVGTSFPRSVVATPNELFWLTDQGGRLMVVRHAGQTAEPVGLKVFDRFLRSASSSVFDYDEFWACWFNNAYLIVADADAKLVMRYDTMLQNWSEYTQYMDIIVASDASGRIFGARHDSFASPTTQRIYRLENGNVDNPENVATAIPCRIRSGPKDLGAPLMLKEVKYIGLDITGGTEGNYANLDLRFDLDAAGDFDVDTGAVFEARGEKRIYEFDGADTPKDGWLYAWDLSWDCNHADKRLTVNEVDILFTVRPKVTVGTG